MDSPEGIRVNVEILDILGVNDKVREVERVDKQAIIMGINIEILDIVGVNDKVRREIERAEKQAMVAVRELT